MTSTRPTTPTRALVLVNEEGSEWEPIFQASNQVVLYNPTSHALSINISEPSSETASSSQNAVCPYCHRPLASEPVHRTSRVPNYFHLLAVANETLSRPGTPPPDVSDEEEPMQGMAQGYFNAFFREEYRLGMGANGSVFLCQHVLDGNPLGYFAVKRIAVGQSHDYLLETLREVRLLETLRHENIITYHHAWLESYQFSSFGPSVPTLYILMQWAEGGSLDDFILSRQGILSSSHDQHHNNMRSDAPAETEDDVMSRSNRIRAFREQQRRHQAEGPGSSKATSHSAQSNTNLRAVHLLSAEEIKSLFGDIVSGLGFLHDRSILHLDLKPGNVLLTWDEGRLIPRAMLSDFGTARDMVRGIFRRTGITGTLEYTPPESLLPDSYGKFHEADSKSDMWSLGIILHKLLFFRSPYQSEELDDLQREVLDYRGFRAEPEIVAACNRRSLPRSLLILLESLLDTVPSRRPSCEKILTALKAGKFDRLQRTATKSSLVPRTASGVVEEEPVPVASPIQTNGSSQAISEAPRVARRPSPPRAPPKIEDIPTRLMADNMPSPPIPVVFITQRPRLLKALKSALLITKIITLATACAPHSPRPWVICATSLLAAGDIWFDSARISVLLGIAHVGIIRGFVGQTCII